MPPFDVPEGDPFGPHNLPYGVFSIPGTQDRTVGVRLGDHVLDAPARRPTRWARRTPPCSHGPPSTRCWQQAARPGPTCGGP